MPIQLFERSEFPSRIGISDVGTFVNDGTFFLDFTRPLEHRRWLGIRNRWIGFSVGMLVPVIHQAEEVGAYVMGISRGEPCFDEIRKLWARHFPAKHAIATMKADGLKIIADFAQKIPRDC